MDSKHTLDSNGSHYFKHVCCCKYCSVCGSMELIESMTSKLILIKTIQLEARQEQLRSNCDCWYYWRIWVIQYDLSVSCRCLL